MQDAKEQDHAAEPKPRIVIADADPLVRRILKGMLQEDGRFTVIAETGDGVEAVELTLHYRPQLLITELELTRLDGLEVTRRVTGEAREARVVVVARSEDEDVAVDALREGASAVIPKSEAVRSLVDALLTVHEGGVVVSPRLTAELVRRLRSIPQAGRGLRPVRSTLTAREWEVLDLMLGRTSTQEIADELFLAVDTVHSHTKSIRRKLGVRSREETIMAAQRLLELAAA